MMNTKDFIALADILSEPPFIDDHFVLRLAEYCKSRNPKFKKQRWLDYMAGKCGPRGGKVK